MPRASVFHDERIGSVRRSGGGSGPESCAIAGRYVDLMIAVQPDAELGEQFNAAGGAGEPRVDQVGLSYDPDAAAATKRALEQFRWFTGGWHVMAELPSPESFAAAARLVREEDGAQQIPVASFRKFVDADFEDIAVVQIGGDTQTMFFEWAETELLPALREAT